MITQKYDCGRNRDFSRPAHEVSGRQERSKTPKTVSRAVSKGMSHCPKLSGMGDAEKALKVRIMSPQQRARDGESRIDGGALRRAKVGLGTFTPIDCVRLTRV